MNETFYDEELEKIVLGAFHIDPDLFIPGQADLFYLGAHRCIYEAMEKVDEQGNKVDGYLVSVQLEKDNLLNRVGGTLALFDIFAPNHEGYTNLENYNYCLSELHELRVKRHIQSVSQRTLRVIEDGEDPLLQIREMLDEPAPQSGAFDLSYIDELEAELELPETPFYATGFPTLDNYIRVSKGNFVIVAGRPSVGKSSLAQNIAYASSRRGKSVLWVTSEMSRLGMFKRLVAQVSACPIDLFRSDSGKVSEAISSLRAYGPFVDSSCDTVAKIKAKAKMMKADIVIADYLQLFSPSSPTDNLVQAVTEISRSLKRLATDLSIPVIAVSQLSRAVTRRTDPRPVLSDLRESGAIEQDADIVLMLYRPEDDIDAGVVNRLSVDVAKNRNGPIGEVMLRFDPALFMFEEA